ncbi:allantoinase AllB [Halalkalibacter hemicellulosilyticus]|uniref:Allantoinase n=1 Tax=Halalkalibacter hemicellulosilyticusJCM 9152 TaxID=1236971 RepID=W4QL34_9BACI|nr:allantoinase AllB [Halalkalibacter hemicellulosilyticus]GAE32049.1 allantoinase [Halalkalibacter hemicellulosilyticusJCM 9152]
MKKVIKNARLYDKQEEKKNIVMEGDEITAILPLSDATVEGMQLIYDAAGAYVFPGFIDVHVHFNDPGRCDWEGFPTGSTAAVAGGVTTVVDMPLNCHPSVIDMITLKNKQNHLRGRSYCNYGLWAGITANNVHQEKELEQMALAGIVGFKGFLSESGIEDFPYLDEASLSSAMKYCAQLNTVLALHAEWENDIAPLEKRLRAAGRTDVRAFLESRPVEAELSAINRVIEIAGKYGTKIHVVHVSHPEVVALLQQAKASGIDVFIETCPHYLLFHEEDFIQQGPVLKCAPPLRSRDSVEGLWECIDRGWIDSIGSDHSPCLPSMKDRGKENIWLAWGGIQGVQFGNQAFISEGVRRQLSLSKLVPLLTSNLASRFDLLKNEGEISEGKQANFVIYQTQRTKYVRKDDLLFRHKFSPYVGMEFQGEIQATIVNGSLSYEREKGMLGNLMGERLSPR